ncbi:MAG TPA: ferredoxin [Solirubrobacteraceae bacterium]
MPRPIADRDTCQGYANCVAAASDVYDIDDNGKVVLLTETIDETDRARVEEAARSCPVGALSLEN